MFKATIDNLLGGVSQQPSYRRLTSQCEEQINLLADVERGLTFRAPSIHKAIIASSSPEDYDAAFLYTINRDDSERYRVVILGDGTIKVFDLDGNAIPVKTPTGTSYLTSGSPTPNLDFRATTIQDTTIIANRKVAVQKSSTTSPELTPAALLYVRDADFSTLYRFTVDGISVDYRTPDGTDPSHTDELNTQLIASQLKAALEANSTLNSLYTATLFGSTVHIVNKNSNDFTITTEEGLGGEGFVAIKNTVQKFEDLPPAAPDGFTVEIVGDPQTNFDNYWVEYSDQGAIDGLGVWQEAVAPNERIAFNATTMPHELVRGGDVLSDLEAIRFPQVAITADFEEAQSTEGWSGSLNGAESTQLLADHNDEAFTSVDDANGNETTYTVHYNLDASGLGPMTATLTLYINDGVASTNWTSVASRQFAQADGVKNNQVLSFTTSDLDANYDIRAVLTESTPGTETEFALVTLTSVTYTPPSANRYVDYSAGIDDIYPENLQVRLTINAQNVTQTLGSDATPAQVAQIMQIAVTNAAISGITATDLGGGVLKIEHSSSAPTVVSSFPSGYTSATVLITDGLNVNAGDLVGDVVENLTDGSTMAITSNGTHSITGAGLSGGSDNTFSNGDACRVVGAGTYFVFRAATWSNRVAGDEETNPFPSFTGRTINEVFFYKNRLGLCADENAILSQVDDYFNFFRTTVTDLLDSAPIDVSAMTSQVSVLVNAAHWDGHLILSSDQADFVLKGDPLLTPKTASLPLISQYGNSNRVRPFVSGRDIYFAKERSGSTRVMRYTPSPTGRTDDNTAIDITRHIPRYIDGMPLAIAGSSDYEILAVLASGNQQTVYIYKFYDDEESGERHQSAWSKWTFPANATVLGIDVVDDNLGLVVQYHDAVAFEIIPVDSSYVDEELGCVTHLDRRVTEDTTGVSVSYDASADVTTWTLPYGVRFVGETVIGLDTFADEDATIPSGHLPDLGFQAWAHGQVNPFVAWSIQDNTAELAGTGAANFTTVASASLKDDDFVLWAKFRRGAAGSNINEFATANFRATTDTAGQDFNYVGVGFRWASASTVNIFANQVVNGGGSITVLTTITLNPGSSIVIGCLVSGLDVDVFTAPAADPTNRTVVGSFTITDDPPNGPGGDARFGISMRSTTADAPKQAIDDLTVSEISSVDDGQLVVVDRSTGEVIPTLVRNFIAPNQIQATGDFMSADVFIGLDYEGSYRFSQQHRREGPNVRTDGWLQFKYWEIDYEFAAAFDAVVDYLRVGGHADKTYSFDHTAIDPCGTSGTFRFPVLSKSDKVTITLRTTDHRPVTWHRAHWEAEYHRKIRR